MTITIRDILGPKWYERKLYDNNSLSTGGICRPEETLGEFIKDTDIDAYEDPVNEIQIELKKCGIQELGEIDSHIQSLIEQKLWDIEEEFNINIIYYTWDYKGY